VPVEATVPQTVYASEYALVYTLLTQEKCVPAVGARLKLQSSGLTGSGIAACVQLLKVPQTSGTMHVGQPTQLGK
jgi:hypothetical protein